MPRFAVFGPFLSVVMVCWRNDPHAAFQVCIGRRTALPNQGKAQPAWLTPACCGPVGLGAEVSGTVVTNEGA